MTDFSRKTKTVGHPANQKRDKSGTVKKEGKNIRRKIPPLVPPHPSLLAKSILFLTTGPFQTSGWGMRQTGVGQRTRYKMKQLVSGTTLSTSNLPSGQQTGGVSAGKAGSGGQTVPGPVMADIRTRILTRLGQSLVVMTQADLPENLARRGDWFRYVKPARVSNPEAMRAALSSNCQPNMAGAMFAAMTVLLNPSRDTPDRATARIKAFSNRLSEFPAPVVSGVLDHWAESHAWQPAWSELKVLLEATQRDMEALSR